MMVPWLTINVKMAAIPNSRLKKRVLKSGKETEFIIIMLRRSVLSDNGREIVLNKVNAGDNICIR